MLVCSVPSCGRQFEPRSGGILGPPAICPRCNKRIARNIPLDQAPRASPGEGREEQLSLRVSTEELDAWKRLARAEGKPVRTWLRDLIAEELRRTGKWPRTGKN